MQSKRVPKAVTDVRKCLRAMQEAGGSLGSSGTLYALDARERALQRIEAISIFQAAVPGRIVHQGSQQQGPKSKPKPRHAQAEGSRLLK